MRKSIIALTISIVMVIGIFSGCTYPEWPVIVRINNNGNQHENIELNIDGSIRFSGGLNSSESYVRNFILKEGEHTFELYREVDGNYQLYRTATIQVNIERNLTFEIE